MDLTPLWAVLCVLFVGTGMYYELVHGDKVSNWETGTFVVLGLTMFVAINRRIRVTDEMWVDVTEALLALGLLLIWIFGTMALHVTVQRSRKLRRGR